MPPSAVPRKSPPWRKRARSSPPQAPGGSSAAAGSSTDLPLPKAQLPWPPAPQQPPQHDVAPPTTGHGPPPKLAPPEPQLLRAVSPRTARRFVSPVLSRAPPPTQAPPPQRRRVTDHDAEASPAGGRLSPRVRLVGDPSILVDPQLQRLLQGGASTKSAAAIASAAAGLASRGLLLAPLPPPVAPPPGPEPPAEEEAAPPEHVPLAVRMGWVLPPRPQGRAGPTAALGARERNAASRARDDYRRAEVADAVPHPFPCDLPNVGPVDVGSRATSEVWRRAALRADYSLAWATLLLTAIDTPEFRASLTPADHAYFEAALYAVGNARDVLVSFRRISEEMDAGTGPSGVSAEEPRH